MLNIEKHHPTINRNKNRVLVCFVCLFPLQAFSHEEEIEKQAVSGWTGQASLSMHSAQGNTNIGSLKVGLLAKHKNDTPVSQVIRGSVSLTESAKNRDADPRVIKDQKKFSYRIDYALSPTLAVGGYFGYEEDQKIKLKSEMVAMVGIERRGMGTKRHQFMADISVGQLQVKYTDGTEPRSAAAVRGGFGYTGKLTDKLSFKESIIVLYSKDRTMKRATSSLDYALTDNVSIALSHEITQRNKIANTAIDKKDDVTDLKLIVKF